MLESVGLVGALAMLGVIVGRVLILVIELRGTTPSERPAIIDALAGFVRIAHTLGRPEQPLAAVPSDDPSLVNDHCRERADHAA